MTIWQSFKLAFKSIYMKKMRSFLTMLGIIIGVASVVIMVSVVQGQNKKNMEFFEKMGNNKITVQAAAWDDATGETSQKLYDYCLSLSDLIDGITPDAEIYGQKITIQYGAKTITVNDDNSSMTGMDFEAMENMWAKQMHVKLGSEQYGICNNYTLAGGREMSYLDISKKNPVCVLGSGAKQELFGFTDPVNEYISINGQPFLVVGWYNSMNIEYSPEMDNLFVLPYTFNDSMNPGQNIESYVVKAKSVEATTSAMTQLDAFLSGMFPKDENGNSQYGYYRVGSDNSFQEDMKSANLMQSLVLGAIAGISLLVGGIGIMNIMLVTVTERTREIGIRKAIGAERKSIITQFLIEASVICSIGGILGIGLGYVGTMIAGKVMKISETALLPSPAITIGAFLFSVILGVIFGMYPAIKASGLQPVVALRAE